MRITLVVLLLLAALHPLAMQPELEDAPVLPQFTASGSVDVIEEIEPNNLNTTGQEVYPGDVVRGAVDMWSDALD